jgi:hypothetical protein
MPWRFANYAAPGDGVRDIEVNDLAGSLFF